MPDISKLSSPIKELKSPITYDRGSHYGSADTALGRYFGNYYDRGLLNYENQQDVRYANQGTWNALGNFAADLGVKTLNIVPSLVGSVTGFAEGSYSALTGGNFSDGFDDNPFLNMSKSVAMWGDEVFPHFQESKFQDKGFLDKLFTSPGQLATANVDSLAFMAQSLGLAGLLAKAQTGARLVNSLAKGKDFTSVFSELAAPNLAKIAAGVDAATLNAFLTTNESALEAVDSKQTVMDTLHRERLAGLNKLSDQEIEDAASNAVNNVFWLNMITNAAGNAFFNKLVAPLFSPKAIATRANKMGLKLLTSSDDMVSANQLTGFEKFLFDEGHTAGMFAKTIAEQVVSEGAEEDLQYSIQKVNDAHNTGRTLGQSLYDYANDVLMHGLDFSDKQRAEATGLGALMGAGSSILFEGGSIIQGKGSAATYREEREKAIAELNKSYTDFTSASLISRAPDKKGKVYSKEVDGETKYFDEVDGNAQEITESTAARIRERYKAAENGEYTIKGEYPIENGQVVKDPVKAADFAKSYKVQSELDDLIEEEASKPNADALKLEMYQLEKLNDLAVTAFRSGSADLLVQKLESYKKLSPENLQAVGVSDPKEVDETVDKWIEHVQKLEKNYLSTVNSIIPVVYSDKDRALVSRFKDYAAEIGNRVLNLDYLISKVDGQISEAITSSKIDSSRLNEIVDVFSTTEDAEKLFPYKTTMWEQEDESNLANLAVKRRQLANAREELGGIYTKMLQPKKGFESYKKAAATQNFSEFKPKSAAPSSLILSDKFSSEVLSEYIDRRSEKLAYRERVKFAKASFYADAINKLSKYFKNTGIRVESLKSLQSFMERIVKEKITMYPDEVSRLGEIAAEVIKGVEIRERKLAATKEAMYNGTGPYVEEDVLEDEEYTIQTLRSVTNTYAQLLEKVKELEGYNTFPGKSKAFREAVIDELTLSANRTIAASGFDGNEIDPDYTDIKSVQYNIEFLDNIRKKGLAGMKEFTAKDRELAVLTHTLRRIETKVKANIADKERRNLKENEFYANGATDLLESVVSLEDLVPPAQLNNFRKLKKLNPTLAGAAAVDLLASFDPELIEILKNNVQIRTFELLKSLEIFSRPSVPEVKWTDDHIQRLIKAPTKGFSQVYLDISNKENNVGAATNLSPLEVYLKTYDIVGLLDSLNKIEAVTSSEDLRTITNLHAQLIALEQVTKAQEGGVTYATFLSRMLNYLDKNPTNIFPSSAQTRVIRELGLFLSAPPSTRHELWDNVAALKAPAGAGKSVVIAPAIKELAALGSEDILTAAPHKLAADNIKNSLGSGYETTLFSQVLEMLENNKIPEKASLLVIDEAGALTAPELNYFSAALARRNRANPDNILKVVMLYDPNQITPNNLAVATLDREFIGDPSLAEQAYWGGDDNEKLKYRLGEKVQSQHSGLPFIENIYNITPLSATYRSDVAEIVDVQNTYKSNSKINEINGAASSNPLVSVSDIKGVYIDNKNTIIEVFKKSEIANPNRNRTIIVGSEAKKAAYQSALPHAEVLTAPESQGITRDEVYIDIEDKDGGYLATPKVFNAFMYTAMSRASIFLHVANVVGNFDVDPLIEDRLKSVKDNRGISKTTAIATIKEDIETLKNILESEPVKDVVEEVEEEEEVEQVEPVDETGDILPPTPTDDIGVARADNTHVLENPSSEVLQEFADRPDFTPIKPGEELRVVKERSFAASSKKQRFVLLQRFGGGENYRVVGVLGESEVTAFQKATGLDLNGLIPYEFENSLTAPEGIITPVETVSESTISSYYSVYVQPDTAPLTYVYSDRGTEDFTNNTVDGKLTALPLLKKYFEDMWGKNPAKHISNYDDILDNWEKHVKFISFKTQKEIDKYFPGWPSDKAPRTGPPYMVIHGIKSSTGATMKNQFIRLTPAILNRSNKTFPLDSLYDFIGKLETFETLLGQSNLPGKYNEFRNGKPIVIGNQTYYPFHALVTALSRAYKAIEDGNNEYVATLTDAPNLEGIMPDIVASKVDRRILELAHELDVLVHGEISDKESRSYKGKAQQAMDAIGTQNLVVSLPTGKNLILRDYRTTIYIKEKGKELSEQAGLSLLGPIRFDRGKGLAYNPLMKEKLITRLADYRRNLADRNLSSSSRYQFIDKIINMTGDRHLSPVTTEDLRALFIGGLDDKGSFTNISEGFGLRAPLTPQFNAKFYEESTSAGNVPTLKDVFVQGIVETNFVKVVPTRIVVGREKDMSTAPPPKVKKVKQLHSIDALRRELREGKAPIADILKKYSDLTLQELKTFMGESTAEAAARAYKSEVQKTQAYVTNSRNIYQALNLTKEKPISKETILEDLETSKQVEGIGKDVGKIASRDFIRGSVFVKMIQPITTNGLFLLSDLARSDYYSGKNKTKEQFTNQLLEYADTLSQSYSDMVERFNEVADLYNDLGSDIKVDHISSLEQVYTQLENIVKISTQVRKKAKEEDFGIELPEGLREFAESLVNSTSDDEFYVNLHDPSKQGLKKLLQEKAGPDEDYYQAALSVIERSLLKSSESIEDLGELLTPEEAQRYLRNFVPGISQNLLSKLLKRGKNKELLRIVKYNELYNSRGQQTWGLYKNGMISLALTKESKIGSRVVRHEAFHQIFWEYLTPSERLLAIGLAKREFGNQSLENLEERMAESFETFVQTKTPSVFQVLWQKLLRLLGFTVNNFATLDKFFAAIQAGVYNRPKGDYDVERSSNVINNFESLAQYRLVKNMLLDAFSDLEKSRRTEEGVPMSFGELVLGAFDKLQETVDNPDQFLSDYSEADKNYILKSLNIVLNKSQKGFKVKKAFIDKFFGQAQTKEAQVKLIGEQLLYRIKDEEERNLDLQQRFGQGEDVLDELEASSEELNALRGEVFDTELENPTNKITGAVRQRLISIKYDKQGEPAYAELTAAFSIIIDKVAQVPTSSLSDALDALVQGFESFATLDTNKPKNIRNAVGLFMYQTARRLQNQLKASSVRKDVTFRKDANHDRIYAIYSKDGSNVQNVTKAQAEASQNMDVLPMLEGGTLDSMLTDLSNIVPNISKKELSTAYYFFEDLDFVRSLIASIGSLRSFQSQIAIEDFRFGKYVTKYIRNKAGGGKQIHESYITDKFNEYTLATVGNTLFPPALVDKIRGAKTFDDKKAALKSLLDTIGIKRDVALAEQRQIDNLFSILPKAMFDMQETFAVGPDKFETLEAYKDNRLGKNILKSESGVLNGIVDILNNHYQLSETHSFMRGDGKKAYGWIDASYQSSLLASITKALTNRSNRKFSTFTVKDGKLSTTDRFLKNNIFFSGDSFIKGFIDHDSIKRKDDPKRAKLLVKENLADFEKRHFVFGFLERMKRTNGNSYFQFLPIPSNRTTIQAAEVKLLKGDEINRALEKIIKSQQNRPDISSNPDLNAVSSYANNYKQWKLAGLEGAVFSDTQKALKMVKDHVKAKVEEISDMYTQQWGKFPPVRLPDDTLQYAANKFKLGTLPQLRDIENASEEDRNSFFEEKNRIIKGVLENFYYNFIINQYSLSQLLYGDETFYTSKEDQTKRIQIVTATGDTLLVDDNYGIPKESNILVVDDLQKEIPADMQGVIAASYRESFDASDAEGFMLPEFYEKVARSYGIESVTDIVMKPVYFSIENGVPTAVKYSVKVLTDDLVAKFPHLATYRQAMRDAGADQMVFRSAVKIGRLKGIAKLDETTGKIIPESVSKDNLLKLNNENLRFQLNPSHTPDVTVANLSQGTAFINTNGVNFGEAFRLQSLNAAVIENGLKKIARKLRLTRKGSMSKASIQLLRTEVLKQVEGVPGGADVEAMLRAVDAETGKSASLSLPLIADRVVSTVASMISKATVGFRFPGSKLVLQADLGTQEIYDDKLGKKITRELQFRDHEGYCEVILPELYREYLSVGDKFLPGFKNGLVGFRIPSTNYHSLLPLKVVGFYPAPAGANANVVIAPSMIVYYHGSDYDVDSLFVIKKSKYSGNTVDLNSTISYYKEDHVISRDFVLEKNKTVTGFDAAGPIAIDGMYLHQYLENVLVLINKQVESNATELSSKGIGFARKSQLITNLTKLEKDAALLSDIIEESAKNHIVDLFSSNMLDMKNRKDLLTPISFSAVKSLRSETKKQLDELLTKDSFLEDLNKAGLIQIIC